MKEIKFRAWDIRIKKFVSSGVYFNNSTMALENISDLRISQFTGLKDKNEKEIYEGDIFESPSGILFYVLWYKDGWYYNNINDEPNHISGRLSEVAEDWEVIDNVYENLRLVKS